MQGYHRTQRRQLGRLTLTLPIPTAIVAVQSNKVYPTPCSAVPSPRVTAASDKRCSLGPKTTMLDDLLKPAKESIAERLASPLLGSFVVAWCLWNYKFLVILLSAASVSQTFVLVESVAFPDAWAVLGRGVLYPFLSAAAYVFLFPYPARVVYGFTHRRQKEINRLRQQIDDETPLTIEESRNLRTEYLERDRRRQELVDRLTSEVTSLTAALEQANVPPAPAPISATEKLYGALEPRQLVLLQTLERAGGPATEGALIEGSKEPKVTTEFDLGELERRKLLRKNFNQAEREYTYEFTHEGRRVLLNEGRPGA